MTDGSWRRITYRLPAELEGPELEHIAIQQYVAANPNHLRIAGAEVRQSDKYGHWIDIHLDTEG